MSRTIDVVSLHVRTLGSARAESAIAGGKEESLGKKGAGHWGQGRQGRRRRRCLARWLRAAPAQAPATAANRKEALLAMILRQEPA